MASKTGDVSGNEEPRFDPAQHAPAEGESLTVPEDVSKDVPQFDRPYSTDDLYATGVPSLEDLFAEATAETAASRPEAAAAAWGDGVNTGADPAASHVTSAGGDDDGKGPLLPAGLLPAVPAPPKRRLPWVWIAAAVVVLLGIGAGAIAVSARAGAPAGEATSEQDTKSEGTAGKQKDSSTDKDSDDAEKTTPAAIVLPECAQLNPLAQKSTDEMLGKGWEVNNGEAAFGTHDTDVFIGDSTRAALGKATQIRGCQYAFHLESGTRLIAAEVPDDARDELIAVMAADSEITQGTIGKAKLFTWEEYVPEGHMPYRFTAHIFLDNAWVLIITSQKFEEQIQAAYDSLAAANPGLGE